MRSGYDLPPLLIDAVKRETEGMTVHWVGQPDARHTFWLSTLIYIFAIPWTLFSLFWTAGASGLGGFTGQVSWERLVFGSFGLPFIAIGFGMLAAPFWALYCARWTAHIIAADRLVTVSRSWRNARSVKTVWLSEIRSIQRTERVDGYGTLKLHTGWHRDSDGDLAASYETLIGIPEVRRVEDLIVALKRSAAEASAGGGDGTQRR